MTLEPYELTEKLRTHYRSLDPVLEGEEGGTLQFTYLTMHSLCSIARCKAGRGRLSYRKNPQTEIIVVIEGDMKIYIEANIHALKPADDIRILANTIHTLQIDKSCRFHSLLIPIGYNGR